MLYVLGRERELDGPVEGHGGGRVGLLVPGLVVSGYWLCGHLGCLSGGRW